jgi:hypothetical protein
MTDKPQDIPPLLHDARLLTLAWDSPLRSLRLFLSCLRRNVDGSPIEDTTVELRLDGVEQIAAYYAPASVEVRPSEFVVNTRLTIDDLENWSRQPNEAYLAVNSRQADFELATSSVQEALFGAQGQGQSELRVHLSFAPESYGREAATTSLFIACDSIQPFATGVMLDIDTWQREFEAWWTGWREHWSADNQERSEKSEASLEDTFIPAGESPPPDLSYRPPSEPPFQVSRTDTPTELLKSIEDYHVGRHEQDWPKMATAYPELDRTNAERAVRLRGSCLGHDFGRWIYVRHIDGWWCEGNRACVVVRGIEHMMPDGENPARNEETVVTYGLRRRNKRWIIATWSQGWPRFASAPKLEDGQAWRDNWHLGE